MESYLWRLGGILLFLAAVAYILIRHGKSIEREKVQKAETEAAINVLNTASTTSQEVEDMTDEELDRHI